MPVVPYQHNGGAQAPLRGFLPSMSSPFPVSDVFPAYTPVKVPQTTDNTPNFGPDASHTDPRPSIDILIEHSSDQQSLGQSSRLSHDSVDEPSGEADTQMKGRKPAIAAASTFLSLATFSQLYQNALFPHITPESERAEERNWVASSHSWLDRKVCDWFGLCGLTHLNKSAWTTTDGQRRQKTLPSDDKKVGNHIDLSEFWKDASAVTSPEDWSDDEKRAREIPQYVLDYAPYIHLYSGEEFWPGDIAEHLIHTTPHLNYTPLQATSDHPNLTNLDDLNRWGRFVYLQSDDNVEDRPEWLGGETNIPSVPDRSDSEPSWPDEDELDEAPPRDVDGEDADWWSVGLGDTKDKGGIRPPPGATTSPVEVPTDTPEGEELMQKSDENWQPEFNRRNLGKKVVGGRSDAPAVLVVVEKDDGVVDAFFFFFYSYNLGNKVFNVRFGNHVGDWEHTLVRFQHGKPKAVFFSEHSFGEAYTYDALEKIGKRPVGYSATGTHAMYGVPGTHPYVLPGGILHDETDRGPLWDPLLNLYSYTYDYKTDKLRSSNFTPQAPTEWFYFTGHWGDKFYPLSDPRQYRFVGQYHYVNGPLGPRFKNLGRKEVCQGNDECLLKRRLGPERVRRLKRWQDVGEGEEMSEEDRRRFIEPAQDA